MELRALAEQILFANTLEEKLQRPSQITDNSPGSAIVAPAMPGRPAELRFKESSSGGNFPGAHRIEDERDRGRLLHFFANHELLATELMALVLLRFPDAPSAFRRGVLQTLKDEQEHTRWYVERMRQCGIQFGELPVSGYFWRAISGMQNPMDYVAGLSLTFEQANLDFARQFARGFASAGDPESAALLEKIYRDEIGHVAYGLKWFRRWKDPAQADWEAFREQLKFPLSPTRAKGAVINVEGRVAAGFDARFIEELTVYAQSRGRTPSVFVFNPFAEVFIAEGMKFTPGKHQADLAWDLANLPQFLGRKDDVVLVPRRPSIPFLQTVQAAGFALPEFVEVGRDVAPWWVTRAGSAENPSQVPPAEAGLRELAKRKLGALRPWAWGPDSVRLLSLLIPALGGEHAPDSFFNEGIARLYAKSWSAELLRKALKDLNGAEGSTLSGAPLLCGEEDIGVSATTMEDALQAVAAIRSRGHHKVVVKKSLGLAGQNAIRLWEPHLLKSQRRWMANALEQGHELVIEPWLERVFDFSVQLEMSKKGLAVRGYTGLVNDRKGQFQANHAGPNYARRFPDEVLQTLQCRGDSAAPRAFYECLFSMLEGELRQRSYEGPVGIDAFVYETSGGDRRLKPVVEINPRYTMGRLLVEMMSHAAPGSSGRFRLMNRAMVRAEGYEGFSNYAAAVRARTPVQLEGAPVARVRSGTVLLNEAELARSYLGLFEVSARRPRTERAT